MTRPWDNKQKQENLPFNGLCRSSGPQSKNQRKRKKGPVLGPSLRTKKAIEYLGDGDTDCNWHA